MTALNVRHVGVVTKDLNKSLKFYRDVLGFKVVKKKMRETDRSLSDLMGLKKVQVTTVKMRSKESGMLELLSWHSPKSSNKVECGKLNFLGLTHFALTVKNVDYIYKKLKKKLNFYQPQDFLQIKK